jgi:hypothetical protein
MKRLSLVCCSALFSFSAHAEISPKSMTLSALSDCMREAIETGSVEENGNVLFLSCSGARAKALYNFIGRKIRTEIVRDRNGRFENRPFGNSTCYHRIEDAGAKVTDDFRCDLVMIVGEALSD